jgi:two-component system NarL family response regulator
MKLLMVEDNPAVRRLLQSLLAPLAETIEECADGGEAVARYAALQPDWVLMDLELPTLDGLSATRQIRARFPTARIVLVTQYSSPALRAAAAQAGVRAYVTKDNLLALRTLLTPGSALHFSYVA